MKPRPGGGVCSPKRAAHPATKRPRGYFPLPFPNARPRGGRLFCQTPRGCRAGTRLPRPARLRAWFWVGSVILSFLPSRCQAPRQKKSFFFGQPEAAQAARAKAPRRYRPAQSILEIIPKNAPRNLYDTARRACPAKA